eukprot:6178393-Pleurochrysis_carterae.AAC.4
MRHSSSSPTFPDLLGLRSSCRRLSSHRHAKLSDLLRWDGHAGSPSRSGSQLHLCVHESSVLIIRNATRIRRLKLTRMALSHAVENGSDTTYRFWQCGVSRLTGSTSAVGGVRRSSQKSIMSPFS